MLKGNQPHSKPRAPYASQEHALRAVKRYQRWLRNHGGGGASPPLHLQQNFFDASAQLKP